MQACSRRSLFLAKKGKWDRHYKETLKPHFAPTVHKSHDSPVTKRKFRSYNSGCSETQRSYQRECVKVELKVYLGFPVLARFLRLISPLSVEQLQASIFLHSLYVETKSVQEEITKTCTKYLCQTLPAISRFRFTQQPVTWILYVSPYWKPFWIFVCAARGTREWSPARPRNKPRNDLTQDDPIFG